MAQLSGMSGLQNFYNALMGISANQSSGESPYGSLVGSQDYLSQDDQRRAHDEMLKRRGETDIYTVNPGRSWGGYDKNNFMPQDLMIYNGSPGSKATNI